VAVVDAIQVHGQDLVFRKALLERDRKDHLVHFASDRFLRGQQLDLHQLLGDGAAALVQAAMGDVHPQGACRRPGVDCTVVVEVAVFGRKRRRRRVRPHLAEMQAHVVVPGGTPVLDQAPIAIENDDVPRSEYVLAWIG